MAEPFDARATHRRFLGIASEFSPALATDMRDIGPVDFPARRKGSFCNFLAHAVVAQSISVHAARAVWGRIEAAARANGGSVPDYLVPAHADTLKACGLSGNKVKALLAIGEADAAGTLAPARLRALPTAERDQSLRAIWGVGQWTCDMAGIFWFRSPDVWPEGDVAVRNTFARYLGRRKPARTAARFAPHRSILALTLWEIVHRMP